MKTNLLFAAFIAITCGCVDSTKDDTGSSNADWGGPETDADGSTTDGGVVDADGSTSAGDDGGTSAGDDGEDGGTDGDDTGIEDTGGPADADDADDEEPSDSDGDGYTTADGDCDDDDASIFPGATEICNEVDDDCDDEIDEIEEGTIFTWYVDGDGDGFGDDSLEPIVNEECIAPAGYASATGDCADFDDMVYPGAVEVCDYIDNDCNGLVDEADPDVVFETWYLDSDRDGYGDDDTAVEACFPPDDDYTAVGGDIDDSDPSVRGDPLWMARIVIEVTWDTAGDDMDLHLLAPGGSLTDSATDCYYLTCKETAFEPLDWGVIGDTSDDPILNMDDISGTGPEVVSIEAPAPGAYTVVVHDYPGSTEYEAGTEVSVRIFLDGVLEVSDTRVITGEDVYQAFTEIVVPADSDAPLEFTVLDEIMTVGEDDGGTGGTSGGTGGSIFPSGGGSSDDGGESDDGTSDDGGESDSGTTDEGGDDEGTTDEGGDADDGATDEGGDEGTTDEGGDADDGATDEGGDDDGDEDDDTVTDEPIDSIFFD